MPYLSPDAVTLRAWRDPCYPAPCRTLQGGQTNGGMVPHPFMCPAGIRCSALSVLKCDAIELGKCDHLTFTSYNQGQSLHPQIYWTSDVSVHTHIFTCIYSTSSLMYLRLHSIVLVPSCSHTSGVLVVSITCATPIEWHCVAEPLQHNAPQCALQHHPHCSIPVTHDCHHQVPPFTDHHVLAQDCVPAAC